MEEKKRRKISNQRKKEKENSQPKSGRKKKGKKGNSQSKNGRKVERKGKKAPDQGLKEKATRNINEYKKMVSN